MRSIDNWHNKDAIINGGGKAITDFGEWLMWQSG